MNHFLVAIILNTLLSVPVLGQLSSEPDNQKKVDTNRVERTGKKYAELFHQQIMASKTDPELLTILQRFNFGEVFYTGNLTDKTRELITITALATNQTLP